MLTLTVYTAYWTPEDVEHGANDPDATRTETMTFDDSAELIEYLTGPADLTEASSYPFSEINAPNTWLSERDPYRHPYTDVIEVKTAHRGDGIDDATWISIVRTVWDYRQK